MRIRASLLFPESEGDSEINLTPMIDVVFILLIFFIVTASFAKETGVEVERPTAVSATAQDRSNILVAITRAGDVWIDRRQVPMATVRAVIERLHAESPQGAVVIQADALAPSQLLVQVIDAARLAGVEDVAIAAAGPR